MEVILLLRIDIQLYHINTNTYPYIALYIALCIALQITLHILIQEASYVALPLVIHAVLYIALYIALPSEYSAGTQALPVGKIIQIKER